MVTRLGPARSAGSPRTIDQGSPGERRGSKPMSESVRASPSALRNCTSVITSARARSTQGLASARRRAAGESGSPNSSAGVPRAITHTSPPTREMRPAEVSRKPR